MDPSEPDYGEAKRMLQENFSEVIGQIGELSETLGEHIMQMVASSRDWFVRERGIPQSFANTISINALALALSKCISMSVYMGKKDFPDDKEAHQKLYADVHGALVNEIQRIIASHMDVNGSITLIANYQTGKPTTPESRG